MRSMAFFVAASFLFSFLVKILYFLRLKVYFFINLILFFNLCTSFSLDCFYCNCHCGFIVVFVCFCLGATAVLFNYSRICGNYDLIFVMSFRTFLRHELHWAAGVGAGGCGTVRKSVSCSGVYVYMRASFPVELLLKWSLYNCCSSVEFDLVFWYIYFSTRY